MHSYRVKQNQLTAQNAGMHLRLLRQHAWYISLPAHMRSGRDVGGGTMSDSLPKFTAAAVQAAPVFMDRDATVDKACALIEEASHAGAKLIVFPETWIPTYPWWHTSPHVFSGQHFSELWRNAIEVPSAATGRLGAAAAKAGAYVAIGINERDTASRGTLYNSLLYLSPEGDVLHRHRKLMPTFTE